MTGHYNTSGLPDLKICTLAQALTSTTLAENTLSLTFLPASKLFGHVFNLLINSYKRFQADLL